MGVLVAALLLTSCSALQLVYAFAQSTLESRAEEYLDLGPEEAEHLEAQATALIAWHRKAMLPKYAVFFSAQADIAETGGWTREELRQAFARFRALVDETMEGAAPFVAEVLAGHTRPEKLAYLEARMTEKIAERRAEEEAETPEESLEEWVERREDRISRFTGPLTHEQIAIIRRYSANGMDNSLRWLDHREKRQVALVAFLKTRPARTEIARFVHRIVLHGHEIVDADYKQVSDARWALRERMYFDVLSTLTDEQRRELVDTLRSYAADMVDLAGV